MAACLGLTLTACAWGKSSGRSADAGNNGSVDAPSGQTADARRYDAGTPDAALIIASMCPANEFATGLDADGRVVCAPIDAAAKAAVDNNCSVYLGWRDSCSGCSSAPSKWGRADGASCSNGTGANNTCTSPVLGGKTINLFGLNTDGGVDGNDKFFFSFHCATPADAPVAGPCPAGSYVSAVTATGVECVTAHAAVTDYMRDNCDLYVGWRDSCDGCTSAPAKWGQVSTPTCSNGLGAGNTCTFPPLGTQTVRLFGLDVDGDVNDDDKFYVGFQCTGAMPSGGSVAESCPGGQLVVGINDNGTVECASPAPATEAVVRTDCFVYTGWRDSCDGCTTTPSKWGRVSHATCENGLGANNTCTLPSLGGTAVPMFGINTDGDVNDDDKFYVGLSCQ